jgi:hypothetical protein
MRQAKHRSLYAIALKGQNNTAQGSALGTSMKRKPRALKGRNNLLCILGFQRSWCQDFIAPLQGLNRATIPATQGVALGCNNEAFQAF